MSRELLKWLVTYDSVVFTVYAATIWEAVDLISVIYPDFDASLVSAHRTSRSRDI